MTRDEITDEAEKYINVSFLHQGRDMIGLDCVGMVQQVANHFDLPYEDIIGYARAPNSLKFLLHLQRFTVPYPILGNKHGTIGIFRQNIFPCHLGIFKVDAQGTWLINARADRRKVVKELWVEGDFRLVKLVSFPGMEN